MKQLGNNWEVAFVMAFIADLAENINEDKKVAELYEGYYKYIHEHQIANLFSLKSYLDVKKIFFSICLIIFQKGRSNSTIIPRS